MSKADHREVDLLLDEIRNEMLATGHLTGCAALEQRVFEVLSAVPRHAFVPEELVDCAYANHPLPIGHGQTISQPYIVALMTELIQHKAEDVILEVGTGSGYQAAILAGLVKQVYSLEIIAELEPHERHVYCGSVLSVSADGGMDSNIAIRTLLCSDGRIHCWAGGGIVADSLWEQEYQETWVKVGSFLSLLEAMGGAG